jgi:signal transduction histidine kinase
VRPVRLLLWPAAVALGLLAEWATWDDPRRWIPDLVVGWTLIGCGLVAWSRRPESRVGLLLAAAGFAWFVPNFGGALPFLHRGPLVHAILGYPRGRVPSRLAGAAVAGGYAAAIATPVWRSETASIVLAGLLVAVAAREYARGVGRARRARLPALQAASVLALVLAGGTVARLAVPAGGAIYSSSLVYHGTLCFLAVGLLADLVFAPWERAAVTDLMVEVREQRSDTLREALARALGDPTLELVYWLPDLGAYVDATGHPLALPGAEAGRAVTPVERDGQPVAALVHDPAVLDDPGLVEAAAAAARLASAHARLQGEVRAQIAELRASRRRLLRARDAERERLERRLREAAERRLVTIGKRLREANAAARGETTRQRIARAEAQLDQTLAELRELAAGIHPRALSELGLAGALASLAERAPVDVRVAVEADGLAPDVEAAAYFVCSEGLANVAKYAAASQAVIRIDRRNGHVFVEVEDDGAGGADPTRGTGLRGLADRIEALGGTLRVESPRAGGTRISAEIPL